MKYGKDIRLPKIELKNCPFCGSKATIKKKYYKGSISFVDSKLYDGVPMGCIVYVGCHNPYCKIQPKAYGMRDQFEFIAEDWNTRK